ncbi:MAG TPA: hypothetical protein VM901_11835 [Bdellovibrionota bacterium]|jgi:hypothetical protein|nr:hypothetical protein [Bdellovibrionota bacterium]
MNITQRLVRLCSTSALTLSLATSLSAHAQHDRRDGVWRIKQDRWTNEDEAGYAKFIQAIGESKCSTTGRCLTSDQNPYKAQNPSWMSSGYSDCADLPYVLRMYYAYMNDLPFSYQNQMSPRGSSRDIRYSANGNSVKSRRVISNGESLKDTMLQMRNAVSTAMFRVPPDADAAEGTTLFPDLYPVKIDRGGIKPGTNIYDPNGHVAVVYKVEADGRVKFMDAHPDNSITRGTYGAKFIRSRPTSGAGFKTWRPIVVSGGKVTGTVNAKLPLYSTEQYYGNHNASNKVDAWKQGGFAKAGTKYEYYDYVRVMLAEGNLRYNPPEEFKNMLDALCGDIKDRVIAVNEAISAGIQNQSHPERLPTNIYGTEGEWETYSTPSRDARLKASFVEMQERVEQFVKLVAEKSPRVQYQGSVAQLKQDLLDEHVRAVNECVVSYKNSAGKDVEISLGDVEERLWDLSFSPYHCIEYRWGARGQELASCPDGKNKQAWYAAQQRLRNQIERTYEVRMDFTIDELNAKKPGSGVDSAPNVALREFLTR